MGSTGWILLHEVHFGIQGDEGPAVFKLWLSELPWLFTSSVAIEEGGRGAQEKEGRSEGRGKEENFMESCMDQTWKWGTYLCAHVIDQTLLCGLEGWEIYRYLVAVEPGGKG